MAAPIQPAALLDLGRWLQAQDYRFTTPTPATHARVNARPDNAWAADLRGVLGWSRPLRAGGALDDLLARLQDAGIAHRDGEGWRSTLRASTQGEQLYFHSAFPTDADDAVFFGPDTCRFLRELLRDPPAEPPRRIVDIGCGAAPAAIALALRYPQAEVIAADVNPQALLLAGVNAQLAGAGNVRTAHSDLLDGVDGAFDLIVANPPYMVDENSRAYRDGGDQLGADLSLRIAAQAARRLATGGQLHLYTGSAIVDGRDLLRERAGACFEHAGLAWSCDEIDPDVFGEELARPAYATVERIAAVIIAARRA